MEPTITYFYSCALKYYKAKEIPVEYTAVFLVGLLCSVFDEFKALSARGDEMQKKVEVGFKNVDFDFFLD